MHVETKLGNGLGNNVPKGWVVKALNDLSTITRLAGYEYSTLWKETNNGKIIALRGFNIGKNRIIEKDFVRISNELSMRLIRSRLFKNDVIYPCVGTIGNAVVIDEDDKYHIQQNIAKITPKRKVLDSAFLAHYLMSNLGLREIDKFNGSSSQPNILVGSLRKYSILTPTLAEQTAIATALSDTDALISSLEKLIAKKRNIKQGAMQQLLKPKKGWEVKDLDSNIDLLTGYPFPSGQYSSNGVRLLRGSNIKRGVTDWAEDITQYWPKVTLDLKQYVLEEGDIVIAMDGSLVGKSFAQLSKEDLPAILLQRVARVRSNKIDMGYLKEFICSEYFTKYCDTVKTSSAIPHISPTDIRKFKIPIPPTKEEQKSIASILSDMESEIISLKSKLEKYRQIKSGMMHTLLTGKIRLV